ncbi:hypothetical protein [Joostella sp.]|uniref:hypothetical protein n=1 Tax=Joostella sp. TaxID=2231138 RepID=UPI003A926FCB
MDIGISYLWGSFILFLSLHMTAQTSSLVESEVSKEFYFEEKQGLVVVEAENFYKQTNSEVRQWYKIVKDQTVPLELGTIEKHCSGASNDSYLKVLPDTRVTHSDTLIHGQNFSNEAGKVAIVSYSVKFNSPGRYYVWVRAFSAGSEDNGIHVGLNNSWPEHGNRMQWCDGKNKWTWASRQRTRDQHCGVPHFIYLDVKNKGFHDVQFSMREDGFEFDKFILTKDINYTPVAMGPKEINFRSDK